MPTANLDLRGVNRIFRRSLYALLATLLLCGGAWALDAQGGLLTPRSGSFETILDAKNDVIQVFSYPGRQPIFVIDFPTLSGQGRMFNRVGALVERMGVGRARVLDDKELVRFIHSIGKNELTFAYGNDFLVSELVVFFNLAEQGHTLLNQEERALRMFLYEQGLVRERFGFIQAVRPNSVILSIPQEKADGTEPAVSRLARLTILTHEVSHAEYYTNPLYRNWCRKFWIEVLNERQRSNLRSFFSKAGYDAGNEDLMINESQAYLLYTPDPRAFSARMVGMGEPELQELRNMFLKGFPDAPMVR
jgi:hypothetical protein